jgi:hypothetical protein
MALPQAFCWSRVGTEAGQLLGSILRRKEEERLSNGGFFFWGIGNAIGPSLRELVRRADPQVVFTPIRSAPRPVDVNPGQIVAWTRARGLDDRPFNLPTRTLITSRFDPASRKDSHYALVCFSEIAITAQTNDELAFTSDDVQNLLTGRPVGASQVTAVVEKAVLNGVTSTRRYHVLLRASLVAPYLLRLTEPRPLARGRRSWQTVVDRQWSRHDAAR